MKLMQKLMMRMLNMLSCEEVNQFIIDYLDDNLPEPTKNKFEKHLKKCPNCSAFFDQYNTTVAFVNEDGQIEIPQDLAELTMEFLREHLPQN